MPPKSLLCVEGDWVLVALCPSVGSSKDKLSVDSDVRTWDLVGGGVWLGCGLVGGGAWLETGIGWGGARL